MVASLERFKTAQDRKDAGFDAALAELRSGVKQGHWIWYVFPQVAGLGRSWASQNYAIADVAEAIAYLQDPDLRLRLLTITRVVADRIRGREGVSLDTLMSGEIDVLKLVSSLTLFGAVSSRLSESEHVTEYADLARAAADVLTVAASQGYPRCPYTLARLKAWP
jgi:uncharacterized protein (DUF1810 family)